MRQNIRSRGGARDLAGDVRRGLLVVSARPRKPRPRCSRRSQTPARRRRRHDRARVRRPRRRDRSEEHGARRRDDAPRAGVPRDPRDDGGHDHDGRGHAADLRAVASCIAVEARPRLPEASRPQPVLQLSGRTCGVEPPRGLDARRNGNYPLLPTFSSTFGVDGDRRPGTTTAQGCPSGPAIGVNVAPGAVTLCKATDSDAARPSSFLSSSHTAVVAWTSPFTGVINISNDAIADLDGSCGDGVSYFVDLGTTQLATVRLTNNNAAQLPPTLRRGRRGPDAVLHRRPRRPATMRRATPRSSRSRSTVWRREPRPAGGVESTAAQQRARPGAGELAVAGDDRAVHDARPRCRPARRRVGCRRPACRTRSARRRSRPGRGRTARGRRTAPGAMRPRSRMPNRSAWRPVSIATAASSDEHAALAHPVLQRPHRVAAVGVALRVRARVAAAELRGRVRDELAEAVVVGAAHRDRELGLEVVVDRDVDQHVDRIVAAARRRSWRGRGRGDRRCAASTARARDPSGR